MPAWVDAYLPSGGTATAPENPRVVDATAALVSIGYAEKDARQRVEAALAQTGDSDLEQLIRAALRS